MALWTFLAGVVVGALLARWAILSAFRHARARAAADEVYMGARTVAVRHLERHGTLNAEELRRLTDANRLVAMRWLDRLVRDGVIRAHTHRGGVMYTKR